MVWKSALVGVGVADAAKAGDTGEAGVALVLPPGSL